MHTYTRLELRIILYEDRIILSDPVAVIMARSYYISKISLENSAWYQHSVLRVSIAAGTEDYVELQTEFMNI